MSYSLDYRKRVFDLKRKKRLTYQQTSELFGVTIRTLFRWKKRIEPKTKRNKPSTKIDMEKLRKDVDSNSDLYQYERAQAFGVSQSAIYYALKRLRFSNKKNSISSKS